MSYSTPVLSGSVPNPVTAPLVGDLSWTASTDSGAVASLLCHCDGTSGQVTFTDDSGNGNVLTAFDVQVSTSDPMFGTGDCNLSSSTANISTPCAAGGVLDLSQGDFTIEMFVKFPTTASLGQAQQFIEMGMGNGFFASGGFMLYWNGGTELTFELEPVTGSTVTGSCGLTAVNNTWYHIAMCRENGWYTLYANGTYQTAKQNTSGTKWAASGLNNMIIGHGHWSTVPVGMEYDEIRVLQGTAAYPQNTSGSQEGTYTPPSMAFSDGGGDAPGYDIYRDGVSIATVGAVLSYIDTVPGPGTYTYTVAGYDPTIPGDISPQSNSVPLLYAGSIAGFSNCIFDEVVYGGYFGGQLNLVEFTYMPGRTPFEEGATNLIINRYKQEPQDVRQRGVDFTPFVVPGELLQTATVNAINAQGTAQASTNPLVTPLVVSNVVIDPVTQLKFAYTVSGGQDGVEYTIQFATTTNIQAQTLEEIFSINIMIEDMFP